MIFKKFLGDKPIRERATFGTVRQKKHGAAAPNGRGFSAGQTFSAKLTGPAHHLSIPLQFRYRHIDILTMDFFINEFAQLQSLAFGTDYGPLSLCVP